MKTLETWLRMVFGAEVEAPGDFGVGLVLRDEGENLSFPLRQLGKASTGALGRGAAK